MDRNTRLLTVVEVADQLRLSRFSVYNLVIRKKLRARKVLNKLRFTQEDVDAYLDTTKTMY